MGHDDGLARRFLHVCLNIRDFDRSRRFYGDALGLRLAMQTDAARSEDAAVLGIAGPTSSRASFMYDWRGPRSSSALELVEWMDPPTEGRPYDDVSIPGLHAFAVSVPSLKGMSDRIVAAGGTVLRERGASVFATNSADAILLRDPDGANVEVVEDDCPTSTVLGIRATCADLDSSIAFYETIGFKIVNNPRVGEFIWGTGKAVTLGLPEDDGGFALCLTQPDGSARQGDSYKSAYHSGFTRMALRVDDAEETRSQMVSKGLALRGPFPVSLGGTAVQDLRISGVDDPDGTLVEFVDRPKEFFRPPPEHPADIGPR
ncbi:VOC family protein [Mycolicibacterium pyrenivorans]|uniref:VOC family protein n=1 Tax=Mycolicibacterium pyrenivorans TaxID=187102 RepID=UPI0021F34F15|nr:VOC family protein [Mycolicibacterium pyrenivorans]MCV7150126.1 VOC family protein [Mycolicibacterium pyrenivorans]